MKKLLMLSALCLTLLECSGARADTTTLWDFSFVSDTGSQAFTGSGSFETSGTPIPLYGYPVLSLDGDLNGQPMALIPDLSDALYGQWFDPGALQFSVGGADYSIYYYDLPLPAFGPGDVITTPGGGIEGISLSMIDPAPVATPESGTWFLLAIGLAAVIASKNRAR